MVSLINSSENQAQETIDAGVNESILRQIARFWQYVAHERAWIKKGFKLFALTFSVQSNHSVFYRNSAIWIITIQDIWKVTTMDERFFQQAKSLIPAEVRMLSGCEDYQTSADVSNVNSKFSLPDPSGRSGGVS